MTFTAGAGFPARYNEALTQSAAAKSISVRPVTSHENLEELPKETTVLVTRDVKLSAANGNERWHIEEKEPLPFQADHIRRLDAKPKSLVAAKVKGDSMEPRLFDDDTVIVDKSDVRVLASGGVFALVYAGELLVKRLFQMPGGRSRLSAITASATSLSSCLPANLHTSSSSDA